MTTGNYMTDPVQEIFLATSINGGATDMFGTLTPDAELPLIIQIIPNIVRLSQCLQMCVRHFGHTA